MRFFPVQTTSGARLLTGVLLATAVFAPAEGFAIGLEASPYQDARLNDVCFVDATHGWAVGDRGTVLHTEDGGKTWRERISEVECPLKSVWFLDHKIGWAVGGASEPYTRRSAGVVLRTENGGRSWTPVKCPIPPLRKVRFVDAQNGWALGDGSPMQPAGLFFTDCGGRAWKAATGPRGPGWLTADMVDANSGAVAGRDGITAAIRNRAVQATDMPPLGLRNLRGMVLVPPVYGWLIGDDGLVMMTGDAGNTWGMTPGALPEEVSEFDWKAIAVRGTHCWIAGAPGTRILHSADAGRTWQWFETRHTAPIRGLSFVDENLGWAVGDFGTILQTTDGGKTWRRQKSGGTRAAFLGVFSEPKRIPLELLVKLCADEGYLGVVEILTRDADAAVPDGAATEDRLQEAILGVGGTGSAQLARFPLPEEALALNVEETINRWNAANDGRAMDVLQAHLVRRIRMWRPSLILTHAASVRGDRPLDHLINQSVLAAVRAAADPTAFPKQITQAGLKPWRVEKVYSVLRGDSAGTFELPTSQIAMRLGRSLADAADATRGLIHGDDASAPESIQLRLVLNQLPHEPTKPDPFNGIILHPGGDARRLVGEPAAESLRAVQEAARRRRNLQAILAKSEESAGSGVQILGHVKGFVKGMDSSGAGHALYQLGRRYARTGHPEMAAETLDLLLNEYPNHPVTPAAITWLLQYYGSGEIQWRLLHSRQVSSSGGKTLLPDKSEGQNGKQDPLWGSVGSLKSRLADQSQAETPEDRLTRAVELGKRLRQSMPQMLARPEIGFPLAAADRRRGFPKQAERFYLGKRHQATHDAWWTAAEGEAWLVSPKGLPPKPVLLCARTDTRPTLDGKLDEAFWKTGKAAELKPENPAKTVLAGTVQLAYDSKFLYLAIRCGRPADKEPIRPSEKPRPRDGDLSKHDRVSLFFDLDRDYATYYRFTVDERGWAGEDCFGDKTWNPDWFVAAKSAEQEWIVEAAIPLHFLGADPARPNEVWGLGIQRITPGSGFQSWTRPAGVEVRPEGFGYLMFR